MAFGSKMHERAWTVAFKQAANQIAVNDVAVHELVARVGRNMLQVADIARVGQLVKIDDPSTLVCYPLQDEVGADETGSSGNQDGLFHRRCYRRPLPGEPETISCAAGGATIAEWILIEKRRANLSALYQLRRTAAKTCHSEEQ